MYVLYKFKWFTIHLSRVVGDAKATLSVPESIFYNLGEHDQLRDNFELARGNFLLWKEITCKTQEGNIWVTTLVLWGGTCQIKNHRVKFFSNSLLI